MFVALNENLINRLQWISVDVEIFIEVQCMNLKSVNLLSLTNMGKSMLLGKLKTDRIHHMLEVLS